MPYSRNPFFTGRQMVLEQVHERLQSGVAAISQAQAIYGLGGIGKTQTAVEYAYRYFVDQPVYDWVFWVRADTQLNLQTDVAELAKPLGLAAANAPDLDDRIRAVLDWLETETGWLLVFDNADQPELLKPLMPRNGRGRVLITSRAAAFDMVGVRQPLALDTLDRSEAVDFLFKRVDRLQTEATVEEVEAATNLAEALGDLPLALEQAGAFILRRKLSFTVYLNQYYKQRLQLLEREQPKTGDYPASVLTTWQLNFEAVAEASPAAADLLRLSAFVAPDEIPYELLFHGREHWSAPLQTALAGEGEDFLFNLSEVLEPLTQYSLIRLEPEIDCYSIHRMVQEVLRDQMGEAERKNWLEQTIEGLNAAFPDIEFSNWRQCNRLLFHTINLSKFGQAYVYQSQSLARLLNQAGCLLEEQGHYNEAKPLYIEALATRRHLLGEQHLDVAASLNNLAGLYESQGRYEEAEPLYIEALAKMKHLLGEQHPVFATSLNNLAGLYESQGRYNEAEPLYVKALAVRRHLLGEQHPDVAASLNNLAGLYESQGRYEESELFYRETLALKKHLLGEQHPSVAVSLNNLAELYRSQGRYKEAESLHVKALTIRKKLLDKQHPDIATSLNNLAVIHEAQGQYQKAESLYVEALEMCKSLLGKQHPYIARSLNNLAGLYKKQSQYEKAEPLYIQALYMMKRLLGDYHPDIAAGLNNLAVLYELQGHYEKAEPLHIEALNMMKSLLGNQHPTVATSLNNLAGLYKLQGQYKKAELLYIKALAMSKSLLGEQHPSVAINLGNLASLYVAQKQYDKPEPLYLEALQIFVQKLGQEHPYTQEAIRRLFHFVGQVLDDNQESILSNHPFIQHIVQIIKTSS